MEESRITYLCSLHVYLFICLKDWDEQKSGTQLFFKFKNLQYTSMASFSRHHNFVVIKLSNYSFFFFLIAGMQVLIQVEKQEASQNQIRVVVFILVFFFYSVILKTWNHLNTWETFVLWYICFVLICEKRLQFGIRHVVPMFCVDI